VVTVDRSASAHGQHMRHGERLWGLSVSAWSWAPAGRSHLPVVIHHCHGCPFGHAPGCRAS
jgi:hypothetical protein